MAGQWFERADSGAFDPANPNRHRQRLAPGMRVGGYTIVAPLGEGAMGAVYRAHDDGGGEVALKIIHPDFDADPLARELMAQEVSALQRLRHPNIAQVFDAELDASEAFIATELIPGKPLNLEIAEGGPLDAADLYELAQQLAAALRALESAGVVHRDIKPGNIIVGENGPVLIDFGIAREAQAVNANGYPKPNDVGPALPNSLVPPAIHPGVAQVANPGTRIMGTPGYLAPELLAGAPPSAATDWWSYAAVLAYAGTGRPPFGYGLHDDVLNRELQGRVDLVGLPPRTATALLSALSIDPADRRSADELLLALRRDAAAPAGVPQRTSTIGFTRPTTPDAAATQVFSPLADAAATQVVGVVPDVAATQVFSPVLSSQPTAVFPPITPSHTTPNHFNPVNPRLSIDQFGRTQQIPAQLHSAQLNPAQLNPAQLSPAQAMLPGQGQFVGVAAAPNPAPGAFKVYQRPVLPKRRGVIWALAIPLVLLGARAPVIAFGVFAALAVLLRVIGTFVNSFHLRRELAGEARNSDSAVVAVSSPFTLVRGVVGALPQLLVGLGAGLLLMALGWWATGANGPVPMAGPWVHPAILAFAMLAALLIAWFGTNSHLTRYGARVVLNTIAPGNAGLFFIVLGTLAALFLAYTIVTDPTHAINWWPGSAPPLL